MCSNNGRRPFSPSCIISPGPSIAQCRVCTHLGPPALFPSSGSRALIPDKHFNNPCLQDLFQNVWVSSNNMYTYTSFSGHGKDGCVCECAPVCILWWFTTCRSVHPVTSVNRTGQSSLKSCPGKWNKFIYCPSTTLGKGLLNVPWGKKINLHAM